MEGDTKNDQNQWFLAFRICQFELLDPNSCYFMKETVESVDRESDRSGGVSYRNGI